MRLLIVASLLLLLAGCITIPGGSDCGSKPDQGEREKCYSDAAVAAAILHNDTNGAISMCDQIERSASPFGSERDLCFMRIAEIFKKPEICNNVESSGLTKSLCISKATPVRSTSVCATAFVLPALSILLLFAYRKN
jgi:hypothetical protein